MKKPNQDYRKIASDCVKAASEAKSQGDRKQLLDMHRRYLEFAKNEDATELTNRATKSGPPTLFK